jgi:hypothetical protein
VVAGLGHEVKWQAQTQGQLECRRAQASLVTALVSEIA